MVHGIYLNVASGLNVASIVYRAYLNVASIVYGAYLNVHGASVVLKRGLDSIRHYLKAASMPYSRKSWRVLVFAVFADQGETAKF